MKYLAKRRGELFRRLKTSEMVTLLQLYVDKEEEIENISNLIGKDDQKTIDITHDCIDNDGLNELNRVPFNDDAYLLLDIRDTKEFKKYHIKSAKSYNPLLIRRDKLGNDIYAFVK